MTTAIEKLTNILLLEAEKCQDRAVFGGLACYTDTWTKGATILFGPGATGWIQEVANRLRAYSDLTDLTARREAVGALLDMLKA